MIATEMSSSKGSSSYAGAYYPSNKGKSTSAISDRGVDQLSHNVSGMNLNSGQDEGWEVISKKSKNRSGNNFSKQAAPQNYNVRPSGHSDIAQKHAVRSYGGSSAKGTGQTRSTVPSETRKYAGRLHGKPQPSDRSVDSSYIAAPTPVIPPPLKNGWGWSSRAANSQPSQESIGHEAQGVYPSDNQASKFEVDDADEESEGFDESDEELLSEDYDSDQSQKSHETRKRNSWFKELFQCLDNLTGDQINDAERQWHCPACKGGPGAIDWYRGLQPVITHAKTKRSNRVKLHRELAELLEEELQRRGTSLLPAGEAFAKWKGLGEQPDKEIVWPPMVMIMNTRLERGDNDKWKGMGNQELVDYFSEYSAVRARHSYGPQGHRGISVLIFEQSAVGFAEAERLSKHFEDKGRNRLAWEKNPVLFFHGGERQLYGFMAEKHDMENFNQHCQGKSKLKYEMRSYQEMVVKKMKQMSEDNEQLNFYKNKVAKEQNSKKALQDSISVMAENHKKTLKENDVLKLRMKKHHEANKEEMDSQEQFFKEQMEQFYRARNEKEENFEKELQSEREKVTNLSQVNVSSVEDREQKAEELTKFIQHQENEVEDFKRRRDELMKAHKERMMKLKHRHWEEEMALEKEFDMEFNKLMAEYQPSGAGKI